jgi:hypothetical protein
MYADAERTGDSPLPRFHVIRYKPDGGAELPGILKLASALAIVGAGLGFLAHWVAQYFYLILLFPALIGLAVGGVGALMVSNGRVRSPLIGGLAGLLGGALAMSMMHYFDYRTFQSEVLAHVHPVAIALAHASPEEQAEVLSTLPLSERAEAEWVLRLASVHSLLDFMNLSAEEGVQITSRSSGPGLNLGYVGSWIYWILEMLVVAGITFGMVRSRTREPYCRSCAAWKQKHALGGLGPDVAAAAAAVKDGDLERLRQCSPCALPAPLLVTAATCASCAGPGLVDLELVGVTQDRHGKEVRRTLAYTTFPREALPHLQGLFAPEATPAALPPWEQPLDPPAPQARVF